MTRKLKQNFGGARWWAILGLIAIWSIGCQRVQAANPPIPYIQDISPVAVEPGATAFTLTMTGVNFTAQSVVQWTAAGVTTPLTTTFVSATQLTATVPASDIAEDGTGLVTVVNSPDLAVSNVVYLPITHSTTFLTFRAAQQSASGADHPFPPVVADFNGDGNLDMAVANDSTTGAVSIFLGDGDGSFQAATSYNVGSQPEGLAVGDFNGDGIPDLAVANFQDATITILLGNGDGTFAEPGKTTTLAANTRPSLVAAGDFNGDGNLDLAVTCLGPAAGPNGFVSILLGNGDGTFGTPANYGTILQPAGLAVADFDGNGTLDLAVSDAAAANDEIWILSGKGDGTFSSGTPYAVDATAGGPAGLVAADFDRNGSIDLAVAYPNTAEVSVLLNSSGAFPTHTEYPTGGPSTFLVAGDLNGDGILDLAAPDSASGTFSTLLGGIEGGIFAFAPYVPFTVGASYSSVLGVASADFNGDGRLDFAFTVVQAGSAEVAVMIQAPVMTPSPSSLDFGNQTKGTTSSPQTITLTNSGGAPLFFYTISSTDPADFPETTTCGKVLESGATCTVSVTFTPSKEGSLSGRITVTDNVTGFSNPQLITLSGTGVAPEAGLSPASLAFSTTQLVGTTSAPQNVTLSNTGDGVLTINSITISTGFTQTNTCGGSVNAGSSCTITVSFAPTATGALNGTLTVTDNSNEASNGTQTVSLTGSGVAPTAGLAPGSLTFASQIVGTASAGQALTLSNTGSAALSITNIVIGGGNSGDFSQTNTCGTSVAAGASCMITVSFKPTATGTRSATVTATDNSNGGSNAVQTASLTGSGVVVPVAGVTPSTLTFAGQDLGTTSAVQTVTLTNSGAAALTVTSVVASGDFAATNTCGSSVAAGANCAISVSFKPTATGARSGTLTVTDNSNAASNSTQTVSLSGMGVGVPQVSLAPSSLIFASQVMETASAGQTLTLSNTGSAALSITNIVIGGSNSSDFSQSNTCGTSVAAGASCTITVSFKPTATGTRNGTLTVTDNSNAASNSTQTVSLSGTGVGVPQVSLAPSSLTFASQVVGTTSAAQMVTLSNTGTGTLTFTSITVSGDFANTSTCGTSLSAGASCTLSVTFTPTATGTRAGAVTITDNAAGSPQTISISGTGTAPAVKLSATSLSFSSENVGSTSPGQTVTITNTGTASLTLTSITASGDFSQSSACGSSLGVGASCTATVTFKPTAIESRTGTLTLTDNASPGTQTVSLTGTGLGPEASLTPASLDFSGHLIGATSAAQTVTLKNVGNAPMNITNIAATGDFTETGTCSTSLAVNASCTISVTFKPTASGARSGALTVSGDSQTVALSGTGQDFALKGAPTASVSPGQSATYNLSVAPVDGLNQAIALSCAGAPSESTCTVSPGSVTLNGSSATSFAVTVATTAASGLALRPRSTPPFGGGRGEWLLLVLLTVTGMIWLARRRPQAMAVRLRLGLVTVCMLVLLALGMAACGGGGSSGAAPSNPGTPAGTYSLTVTGTATSGSATVTQNVTLTLQVN